MKISNFSRFAVVVALCATGHLVKGSEEDQFFTDFVQVAMRNYSSWLKSNNHDPTPVLQIPANMTFVTIGYNMTGEIRNQQIFNHSNLGVYNVFTSLDESSFGIKLDLQEFQVNGEYDIAGWIGKTEISGSGKANLTSQLGLDPVLYLSFINFTITPEGFVNLAAAEKYKHFESGFVGDFENLSAGNHTAFISKILADHVFKFQLDEWFPLYEYLASYLGEVFEQTAYSDIIQGRGIS